MKEQPIYNSYCKILGTVEVKFLSIKDQFTNGFREFLNHASFVRFFRSWCEHLFIYGAHYNLK